VLTGETGAGKSILVDALQLAWAHVPKPRWCAKARGGPRSAPNSTRRLAATLAGGGRFAATRCCCCAAWWKRVAGGRLGPQPGLDQRQPGHAGAVARSRRPPGGHPRPACLAEPDPSGRRARLARHAGRADTAPLQAAWAAWRDALQRLQQARAQRDTLERERERLAWQIAEVDKLAPGADEWDSLNAEHQRLAHGQALLDGARAALAR
jgi:DNA repair protein RecN (Recombination protein N)